MIAYAAKLHIQVIPEIDVPGHATAAIAAYPELGSIDTPLKPISEWGVFPNLFNVEDSTVTFLENVLEEVIELFREVRARGRRRGSQGPVGSLEAGAAAHACTGHQG